MDKVDRMTAHPVAVSIHDMFLKCLLLIFEFISRKKHPM